MKPTHYIPYGISTEEFNALFKKAMELDVDIIFENDSGEDPAIEGLKSL